MRQSGRSRALSSRKFFLFPLFLLIVITCVSFMYKSSNQLEEYFPTRLLSATAPVGGNPDVVAGGSSPFLDDKIIIPVEERRGNHEIRYASFGSSVTYGVGLGDREKEAYAWRLSNSDSARGMNFGIRAVGPNYPASCIYTMIGEQEFDVIVLEYFMRGLEGLMTFALRIRERFPNAIIIMTKLWGPYQYFQTGHVSLTDWASKNGFGRNYIHDPLFSKAFLAYGEDKFRDIYGSPNSPLTRYHEAVAKEIGAYVVKMPRSEHAGGPGGWIELGHKLLATDSFHLSAEGHANLASQIKAIVDRIGVPKNRTLGEFRGVDHCHNWFESGEIGEGLEYSPNGLIRKMENTEKNVLSFGSNAWHNKNGAGWIKVTNPSDQVMDMFVAYMSSGPPPSKYPKVEVARDSRDKTTYILEPEAIGWSNMQVHIARVAYIGKIYPNTTDEYIHFNPLEKTEYPFRLVAFIITPFNENGKEKFNGLGGGTLVK